MILRELKPRRNRTRIASQRRSNRFMRGIFNRYHFHKALMSYGRRKLIRWWHKTTLGKTPRK